MEAQLVTMGREAYQTYEDILQWTSHKKYLDSEERLAGEVQELFEAAYHAHVAQELVGGVQERLDGMRSSLWTSVMCTAGQCRVSTSPRATSNVHLTVEAPWATSNVHLTGEAPELLAMYTWQERPPSYYVATSTASLICRKQPLYTGSLLEACVKTCWMGWTSSGPAAVPLPSPSFPWP